MLAYQYYLVPTQNYDGVTYANGTKSVSVHAKRNSNGTVIGALTLKLTDNEFVELQTKMPSCKFVRDNRITPEEREDDMPVTAAIVNANVKPTIVHAEEYPTKEMLAEQSKVVPSEKSLVSHSVPESTVIGKAVQEQPSDGVGASSTLGVPDALSKIDSMTSASEIDNFIKNDPRVRIQKAAAIKKATLLGN